jgi:competence protein ComEA
MANRPTGTFDESTLRGIAVVAAAALLLAGVWWFAGRDAPATAVPRTVSESSASVAPSLAGDSQESDLPADPDDTRIAVTGEVSADEVVVDIRGPLRRPGILRLPSGSRVLDAIKAAGGLRAGRGYGSVNLARVLVDGEQIRVGVRSPSGTSSSSSGAGSSTTTVAINTADAGQLEQLDGIGEVLAGRIVAWREENGPFQSAADLMQVPGIGEQTLTGFADQVTVG